ncbi:uncharacterized protein LOC128240826 [Mya arenaria]|uniref:uncharacterized protein LOC128240826 n=1 Tax=Mya arenaria TaxID=6604 RepID=UPI0022E356D6|nr:uncharacterized protein LOC128240826 [Mya arenaria]
MSSRWSKVVNRFTLTDTQLVGLSIVLPTGFVSLYFGSLLYRRHKIKTSEYTNESFRILKGYPHIGKILGEDVDISGLFLYNPFTFRSQNQIKLSYPIKGSLGNKASLVSWCSLQTDPEDNNKTYWRVDKLNLWAQVEEEGKHVQWTFFQHPECPEDPEISIERANLEQFKKKNRRIRKKEKEIEGGGGQSCVGMDSDRGGSENRDRKVELTGSKSAEGLIQT